ncbi:MAG: mechanosensitive ion channel family protein [Bryobacteraceae bacterium]
MAVGFRVCALLVSLLAAESAWAQARLPGSATLSAQAETPRDPLGRNTPRGTVSGFLTAVATGDDETATGYLNTRVRGKDAVTLARQLFVVLNSRLPARLYAISDKPEGSLIYPSEPNKDLVGTVRSDSGDVDIVVERIDRKNDGSIWLFSRETLAAIPELYAEVESEPPETGLLRFLLETKIARIPLVQWLAVFVGLPLFHLLGVGLNRSLSAVSLRLLNLRKNAGTRNVEILPMPVRLLLLALLIRWGLSKVAFPLMARQFWSGIATLAAIAGMVWLVIRLNNWFEDNIRLRCRLRNLTSALSILHFARSAADALVIVVGLLVVLYYFGINPVTVIAGLGIGGIAIALAAQKTLENLIAGISLISDNAIRVGDFLKVGDTSGTVTEIGLRSTRIRTLDRALVNVPNGQIANATLENLSLRDQFWFHHRLRLTYETTAALLRSILAGLTNLLLENPSIDKTSVRVRFLGFGESWLDVEIFAYVNALDWPDFLRIQEELLLQLMDLVQAGGGRLALPSQITYLNTPDSNTLRSRSTTAQAAG